MHVGVISTEDLGDRGYLVHDGTSAVVVDPQRDVDRVEKALADLGVRCAMVVETHIHNDYVTGVYDLSMRNGCPYVVNAAYDLFPAGRSATWTRCRRASQRVHCASGYRASIAASLLDGAGRDVVFIEDSFDNAVAAGLTHHT